MSLSQTYGRELWHPAPTSVWRQDRLGSGRTNIEPRSVNSVSEIAGSASLMLFFATDTLSFLTAPVIRVTQTLFSVVKTIRSVTATHWFIAEQHCFLKLQHGFAAKLICFVAWKSLSINEVALPAPATHCFGLKSYCFLKLQ